MVSRRVSQWLVAWSFGYLFPYFLGSCCGIKLGAAWEAILGALALYLFYFCMALIFVEVHSGNNYQEQKRLKANQKCENNILNGRSWNAMKIHSSYLVKLDIKQNIKKWNYSWFLTVKAIYSQWNPPLHLESKHKTLRFTSIDNTMIRTIKRWFFKPSMKT